MWNNILIAGGTTFLIFISVEFVISIRQLIIFKKIRAAILLSTFNYLKKTPQHFVDLQYLTSILHNRLQEAHLKKWVVDIKISWHSVDSIQFVFELNFEKLKPKYKFVIGLNEFDQSIQGK